MGDACSKHPRKANGTAIVKTPNCNQSMFGSNGIVAPTHGITQTKSVVNQVANASYVSAPTQMHDAIIVEGVSRTDIYAQAAPCAMQQTTTAATGMTSSFVSQQACPVTTQQTCYVPATGVAYSWLDMYGNPTFKQSIPRPDGMIPRKNLDNYGNQRRNASPIR